MYRLEDPPILDINYGIGRTLKDIESTAFTFNGGEEHVRILNPKPHGLVTIAVRPTYSASFMRVLMATDALRRSGTSRIQLLMPYFPGARQDRVMVQGEPLSAKVYANIINSQNYEKVYILDPHSDVTPALIDRCVVVTNEQFIKSVLETIASDVSLVFPDSGASKKYQYLALGRSTIECKKKRDVSTGALSGFEIVSGDPTGKHCLIVDDICDGGATFVGINAALKAAGALTTRLAVSHGIFSKGLDVLSCFADIYTTDSLPQKEHNRLTVIRIHDWLKP